jgi:steroid delta-isomerase-like uncharacterized protein
MSTQQNKLIAARFYEEVFNAKKLYLLEQLVSPDFVDHNPEPGQEKGIAGIRKSFAQFLEAFPDMRVEILQLAGDGDRVCARVNMTATHQGTFNGLAATGRRVSVTGIDWLRLKDGKVVERWGVFDMTSMMQQLGAVPGPAAGDLKAMSARYYKYLDEAKGNLAKPRAEIFHAQHVAHFGNNPRSLGVDELQGLATAFWAAFPNLQHEVVDQVVEGNVVFNRLIAKATHKGEFAGVAATNKQVKVDAIAEHHYVDGKLFEQWIQPDMMSLLQQIGAIPAQS